MSNVDHFPETEARIEREIDGLKVQAAVVPIKGGYVPFMRFKGSAAQGEGMHREVYPYADRWVTGAVGCPIGGFETANAALEAALAEGREIAAVLGTTIAAGSAMR